MKYPNSSFFTAGFNIGKNERTNERTNERKKERKKERKEEGLTKTKSSTISCLSIIWIEPLSLFGRTSAELPIIEAV